jgi:hypothetical protein
MELSSQNLAVILVFAGVVITALVNLFNAHRNRRAEDERQRRDLLLKGTLELSKTSNAPLSHHAEKVAEIIDRPKLRRVK